MARGAISNPPNKEMVDILIAPEIRADLDSPYHVYQAYLDVNKAHVLMLEKQGIIARKVAKDILKVTKKMAAMGDAPAFEIDPEREDLYFNLEHYLIEKTSPEIGGQQHTARSRNDLYSTVLHLSARNAFFEVSKLFLKARETILELAEKNTETVLAGMTCLQPSEPVTVAHYLSGILANLERDFARLAFAYRALNLSPLGACSMGSTTWPIDRKLTAKLMGFDAPFDNSIDSVANVDFIGDILAAFTSAGNTLSRLAYDMYLWCTPEYGYLEVDDGVALCSSIMPQKKNPITFEHIKAKASHLAGFYVGAVGTTRGEPFGLTSIIYSEAPNYMWSAFREMGEVFRLVTATLEGVKFKKERMVENARGNFCTVTELANTLVRVDGISFRTAHDIVADIVRFMLREGRKSNEIDAKLVGKFFKAVTKKPSKVTDRDVALALDPVLNAKSKKVLGGTAPSEVKRQLRARRKALEADASELAKRLKKTLEAKKSMEKMLDALVK